FDQVAQAHLIAVMAIPYVAEGTQHSGSDTKHLLWLHEYWDMPGHVGCLALVTTEQELETDRVIGAKRGDITEILGPGVRGRPRPPRQGGVELAGEIGKLAVAHDHGLDLPRQFPGVDEFLSINAAPGVRGDVAHVIMARLARRQPDAFKRRPHAREFF